MHRASRSEVERLHHGHPERALAQARRAEDEVGKGRWRGPLHGIPIAVKDNVDTAGVLTTAASGGFRDTGTDGRRGGDQRLKSAGAVSLGKLNMHEFALGTTSAISHYGAVRNPWDLARVAGGSSGGSGAAVAAACASARWARTPAGPFASRRRAAASSA
jgi:aspartyl-tRNA(Asn)/glutamyl-tRNA(Gln) amidotransferase subunit A